MKHFSSRFHAEKWLFIQIATIATWVLVLVNFPGAHSEEVQYFPLDTNSSSIPAAGCLTRRSQDIAYRVRVFNSDPVNNDLLGRFMVVLYDISCNIPLTSTYFFNEDNRPSQEGADKVRPYTMDPDAGNYQSNCVVSWNQEEYGYDKGHLTPARPFYGFYNSNNNRGTPHHQTHYCTNIAPQFFYTNQILWRNVEAAIFDSGLSGIIMTGTSNNILVGTGLQETIPKYFFKLFCYKTDDNRGTAVVGFLAYNGAYNTASDSIELWTAKCEIYKARSVTDIKQHIQSSEDYGLDFVDKSWIESETKLNLRADDPTIEACMKTWHFDTSIKTFWENKLKRNMLGCAD